MNLQGKRIVWGVIVFGTVLYLVIALFVARDTEGSLGEKIQSPLVMGLYLAAAASFLAANMVPRTLAAWFVVSLALLETVAILGLVAALVLSDWRLILAPWLLSMAGFIRLWPARE